MMVDRIKFGEVKIGDVARHHIDECLQNHYVTGGAKVKLLEEKWCEKFGQKYSINVSSGTAADTVALMALYGLRAKRGDKVIVPSLCFFSVYSAVLMAGFTPLPCDIRRETLNINEDLIEDLLRHHTNVVAIMPVTTMGKPYDAIKVRDIADKYGLTVICDNCEGVGCGIGGKLIEEYADMTTCSMYAAHLIFGAENGMVTTNNYKLSKLLYSIRSHGRPSGSLVFNHQYISGNFKNTDIHASIALESIDEFYDTFTIRKGNWRNLTEALSIYKNKVHLSEEKIGETNSPHGISITLKEDNPDKFVKLQQALDTSNIEHKLNFLSIPTQQSAMKFLGYKLGDFPEAEFVGRNGLHVGCHKFLKQADLNRIVYAVEKGIH